MFFFIETLPYIYLQFSITPLYFLNFVFYIDFVQPHIFLKMTHSYRKYLVHNSGLQKLKYFFHLYPLLHRLFT